MLKIWQAALVYATFVLVSVLRVAWYYGRLPQTVASHFDSSGIPDGWMGRGAFAAVNVAATGVAAVLMLLMYAVFAKAPFAIMNIPKRQYWTAPQRQELTRRILTGFALRFGIALLAFLEIVGLLVTRANLQPEPRMSAAIWPCLAVFLAFVIIQVIWMIWRFYRIPPGDGGDAKE